MDSRRRSDCSAPREPRGADPAPREVAIRIAQATLDGNLPRYGIGLAVVRLCGALAADGHEVVLLCREANAADVPAIDGVRVVGLARVRAPFLGRSRRAYVRQVREALTPGVDVVHVHGATRLAHWLLPARARGGAPLVVTCHSADEIGPSASASGTSTPRRARRHARHAREVLARADAVTAPSRWMAARVREFAGRDSVAAIGLGPTDETPLARAAHEGFRVVALARLVPAKGMGVLLEAFLRAFPADARARLVLAGEGPEANRLQARAAQASAADRVEFPGYVEGPARRDLLARADVVVVPTCEGGETFGLAALDASAAGVPVVVSDTGALPERVEGGGGILVPPGDPAALASALSRLHGDPGEAARLGEEGLASSRGRGWREIGRDYGNLYVSLAEFRHLKPESSAIRRHR